MAPAIGVFGGVPRRRRPSRRTASLVEARRHGHLGEGHPAGGDGAGFVQHAPCRPVRVDSSTSGPLIRMPSCAPGSVPTSSAVGVARPSAHGQAMISTATAAVKAAAGARAREPEAEGAHREGDHDRHEDAGDPVGQALHAGLAGLGLLDQAGHLGQRGVGARPGWPAPPAARRR